jgi:hypothetical protein
LNGGIIPKNKPIPMLHSNLREHLSPQYQTM